VSGGKKPRPNPSRDNKKDPNDNFAKRGLKTTNIKGSKPITGLLWTIITIIVTFL